MTLPVPTIVDGSIVQAPALALVATPLASTVVAGDAIGLPLITLTGSIQGQSEVDDSVIAPSVLVVDATLPVPLISDATVAQFGDLGVGVTVPLVSIDDAASSTVQFPTLNIGITFQDFVIVSGDVIACPVFAVDLAQTTSRIVDAAVVLPSTFVLAITIINPTVVADAIPDSEGREFTLPFSRTQFTVPADPAHFALPLSSRTGFTLPEE